MLLSPYIDGKFKVPDLKTISYNRNINIILCLLIFIILYIGIINNQLSIKLILFTLFISTIPEEWFFRVYFQTQLIKYLSTHTTNKKSTTSGIILTSLFFSCMHVIMQGDIHLIYLIFFPSVLYGYIYLITKNLFLVINLHFISNILLYTLQAYI